MMPLWLAWPFMVGGVLTLILGLVIAPAYGVALLVLIAITAFFIRRRVLSIVLYRDPEAGMIIWTRSRRHAESNPNFRPELHFLGDDDAPPAQAPTID